MSPRSNDYVGHLTNKVQFLARSTSAHQHRAEHIIKVLTIVSVVGVPPTLVASMYGMNFKTCRSSTGLRYPYGLTLIFCSAAAAAMVKFRRLLEGLASGPCAAVAVDQRHQHRHEAARSAAGRAPAAALRALHGAVHGAGEGDALLGQIGHHGARSASPLGAPGEAALGEPPPARRDVLRRCRSRRRASPGRCRV